MNNPSPGNIISKLKASLSKLSFKTGVIILCLCIPFYIISFAQMALDISYTLKGILWLVFFGLAKTFQYSGLAIIGVDGIKRLKSWWGSRSKSASSQEEVLEISEEK